MNWNPIYILKFKLIFCTYCSEVWKILTMELGGLVLPVNSGVHLQVTRQVISRALHEGCTQRQPIPWLAQGGRGSSFLLTPICHLLRLLLGALSLWNSLGRPRIPFSQRSPSGGGAGAGEKTGADSLQGSHEVWRQMGRMSAETVGVEPLHCHDPCFPPAIATLSYSWISKEVKVTVIFKR